MTKRIQEAITARTSRRSYQAKEFTPELEEQLNQILKASSTGPLGNIMVFNLIQKYSGENQKLKLGTYGFISGARYFIIGQTTPEKSAYLDYGYLLERIILECTALNLGTCWLGGTFDRGEFSKTIDLLPGNVIPAITPVGFSTQNRSIGDKVIRLGAGSRKRKEWDVLFFDGNTDKPLKREDIGPERSLLLEMLRIAPSASNIQPWRIFLIDNVFHFYLNRKPGYGKAFGKIDLQMIDIGIAMSHFDLTAKEIGVTPVWEVKDGQKSIENCEYIVSVSI